MDAVPVGAKGDIAFNEQSQQLLVKQGDNWNRVATQAGSLRSIPQGPSPAESLLKQAVWWIDANHSSASGQRIRNLGWGGSVLDATAGSSGAADSDDPKFLDFEGTPYVYLPGTALNYMSVPAAGTSWPTGDLEVIFRMDADNKTIGGLVTSVRVSDGSVNLELDNGKSLSMSRVTTVGATPPAAAGT